MGKSTIILKLNKNEANFWNQYLAGTTILHNTTSLFIHAHRPYWEYYLDDVDTWHLSGFELGEIKDQLLRSSLEAKKRNNALLDEPAWADKAMECVSGHSDKELLLLTTKHRALNAKRLLSKMGIKAKALTLPDKVASLEIEPGWALVENYLKDNKFKAAFVALGWEKVIYAGRLKKLHGISVVDCGEVETVQQNLEKMKAAAKAQVKKILKKIRK